MHLSLWLTLGLVCALGAATALSEAEPRARARARARIPITMRAQKPAGALKRKQEEPEDSQGEGDASHGEAYNSIISQYYTTDPFFGDILEEDEEQAAEIEKQQLSDVRNFERKEQARKRAKIPAPLLVRDEVSPLDQRPAVSPRVPVNPSKIPAPLLVGGGGGAAPSKPSAPRMRMHIKKTNPGGVSKRAPTPMLTSRPALRKTLRRIQPSNPKARTSLRRPERQVFSQLLSPEVHPELQKPAKAYDEEGPTEVVEHRDEVLGQQRQTGQPEEPEFQEFPRPEPAEAFPGDTRGDIPQLPVIEGEGDAIPPLEDGQYGVEPTEHTLYPGDPGAPPRTTYFDIMGDFFESPEINLFKELGPPPPPPPPSAARPHLGPDRSYPQQEEPVHKEPEHFPRQFHESPRPYHEPEPYYEGPRPQLPPPYSRHPEPPHPVEPLRHYPAVEPKRPHEKPYYPAEEAYYPVKKEPYHPVKEAYAPPEKPYHPVEKPYAPPEKPYHPGRKPYVPAEKPYHPPEKPYHSVKKPYHPYPQQPKQYLPYQEPLRRPEPYSTPAGHPYAPPLSRPNPLDQYHHPGDVEPVPVPEKPLKRPKQFPSFLPDTFVDIPKEGAAAELNFPQFKEILESPVESSEHLAGNPLNRPNPFSNLHIQGSLVPSEHRSIPEPQDEPVGPPRPPHQVVSSLPPKSPPHYGKYPAQEPAVVAPPAKRAPQPSPFDMPFLGPPKGFLEVTRDVQFPVDVPKLGSKVPYQPPELLYDAFHSGPHAHYEHNHVKKEAPKYDPTAKEVSQLEDLDDQIQQSRTMPPSYRAPTAEKHFRPPPKASQVQQLHSSKKFSSGFPQQQQQQQPFVSSLPIRREKQKKKQKHNTPYYQPRPEEIERPRPEAQFPAQDRMPSPDEFFKGLDRPDRFESFAGKMAEQFELSKVVAEPEAPPQPQNKRYVHQQQQQQPHYSEPAYRPSSQYDKENAPPKHVVYNPKQQPGAKRVKQTTAKFQKPTPTPVYIPNQPLRHYEHEPQRPSSTGPGSYVSRSHVGNTFSIEEPSYYQYSPSSSSSSGSQSFQRRFGAYADDEEPVDLLAQEVGEEQSRVRSPVAEARALTFASHQENSISYEGVKVLEKPHQFTHVDGYNQFRAGHNRGHPDHHIQDTQERNGHKHKQEAPEAKSSNDDHDDNDKNPHSSQN